MMKWMKQKITNLLIGLTVFDKKIISTSKDEYNSNLVINNDVNVGTLLYSLKKGEMNSEVLDLRWRTYKVLREVEGVTAEIVGYDDDGMPIVKTKKKNKKLALSKIKLDPTDQYKLEMVVDNAEIVIGGNQAMENENISLFDEIEKGVNENGDIVATHGVIDSVNYFATNKSERPIMIIRDNLPNFYLENFTLKLNVRNISKTEKLLEFYVSKYPDEFNRTSRLFISEIKKIMGENYKSTMLDFEGVNFITYKTLGVDDFLEYEYDNISFDKVVEFNGYYIIKFIANLKIDGKDILEIHRVAELDKKYEQKLKK